MPSAKKLLILVLAAPLVLLYAPMHALAFIELKSNFKRNALSPFLYIKKGKNRGVDINLLL